MSLVFAHVKAQGIVYHRRKLLENPLIRGVIQSYLNKLLAPEHNSVAH